MYDSKGFYIDTKKIYQCNKFCYFLWTFYSLKNPEKKISITVSTKVLSSSSVHNNNNNPIGSWIWIFHMQKLWRSTEESMGWNVCSLVCFWSFFFAVRGQVQLPIGLITFFFCSTHLRSFVLFVLSAHNSCFIHNNNNKKCFLSTKSVY